MSTRSHAIRVAAPVDREWRRLVAMLVAVALVLGAIVVLASLNPNPSPTADSGRDRKGSTETAPAGVNRVGGHGDYQYKVLP